MRKSALFFMALLTVSLLSGCNSDSNADSVPSLDPTLNQLNTDFEHPDLSFDGIEETVNTISNFSISDSFYTNFPDQSAKLYTFQRSYYDRLSGDKHYAALKEIFEYIYPEATIDEKALYFFGDKWNEIYGAYLQEEEEWRAWQEEEIENGTWDPNTPDFAETHPTPDPPSLSQYRDELMASKEENLVLAYDLYLIDKESTRDHIFLYMNSPAGADVFRFNRGEFARKNWEGSLPFLETITPAWHSEFVASYPPDSEEVFQLVDGDCAICDAVQFYEEYINSIPLQEEITMDMKVMKVNVLKDKDGNYLYWFVTASAFQGVSLDYRDISVHSTQSKTRGETGALTIFSGCMTNSNSVEYLDGLYRIAPLYSVQPLTSCISAADAVKRIAESVSGAVTFRADSMELVYTVKEYTDFKEINDVRQDTKPMWKMTLYNENDHRYYVCYVNVADGEGFRYYTYAGE